MLSDTGRVRSGNEDSAAIASALGAFVVCDGMGGAAAGEVASQLAATTFLDGLRSTSTSALAPQTRLRTALLAANEAVFRHSQQALDLHGMGTTLVALLHIPPPRDRRSIPRHPAQRWSAPPDLLLANIGDSRCYRLRDGVLHQLTTDHSFVEEQLRAGQITAAEAAVSPMRNYITRAIGPHTSVEPDIESYRTEPGDLYLLCSDGLTRELDDPLLADLLRLALPTRPVNQAALDRAAQDLIHHANNHGGRDNITVILVAFS